MPDIAQKHVEEHKIAFSTHPKPAKSKTKYIIFSKKTLTFNLVPLQLTLFSSASENYVEVQVGAQSSPILVNTEMILLALLLQKGYMV